MGPDPSNRAAGPVPLEGAAVVGTLLERVALIDQLERVALALCTLKEPHKRDAGQALLDLVLDARMGEIGAVELIDAAAR